MEGDAAAPLPSSQASSRFIPAPIPATVIAEIDARRRNSNRELGACRSACPEVDDYVLLGGFERGSVVSISCEEENFGVSLAIQVLAHGLCSGTIKSAHVVTPKPKNVILAAMRDGIYAELRALGSREDELAGRTRECLARVMLSCVFDMTGVWEVVAGLDRPVASPEPVPEPETAPAMKDEIEDSQEEDDFDEEDSNKAGAGVSHHAPAKSEAVSGPDVVVITHFGPLMTGLFTHRSSSSAHRTLQLLSSHIRHLSRSLPSSPLFLLLNSTTSSTFPSTSDLASTGQTPAMRGGNSGNSSTKPLDPTLRSIFNPPYIPGYAHGPSSSSSSSLSRRNKPMFGLVFSQMLDMHLLCTRVPKTSSDVETLYGQASAAEVEYVTVVEVLLDEMGVWPPANGDEDEMGGKTWEARRGKMGHRRRSREQRWGAVMVRGGRVVNAFEKGVQEKPKNQEEVKLAAGFGGPKV